MGASGSFDPQRYLTTFRGKPYLEIRWRLVWLREVHPDAMIETEMVSHILNPPMAIFKARVSLLKGGSATGWGQEEAADFGDYLEKAETKALGRALAALGFGTQFAGEVDDGRVSGDAPEPMSRALAPVQPQSGGQTRPEPAPEPIVITLPAYPGAQWSEPLPDGTKTLRLDGIECYGEPSRKNPAVLLYKTLDTCDVEGHGAVPWTTYLKDDGRLIPWYHTYNLVEEGTGEVTSAYCMMANPG